MKGKLLQKSIAAILILCMTATNFIFAATSTVYAIASSAELENGNIVFEAYFKDEGKKVNQKTAQISQGEKLYIGLELKAGKLQEAKVKIDNANFKIVEDQVSNKFVNSVNTTTNEIVLNEVSYNDSKNGVIEIELPIKFEEAGEVNTAYFEMENAITLSGKYINSSENGKEIKSNPVTTKLIWSEPTVSVGWNGNIEKIISMDNKVLVQANIQSTYSEGVYFPKEAERITVSVPKVNDIKPSYTILADGEKLDASSIIDDVTTDNITFSINFTKGENIKWNKAGNTYKIIYVYDGITRLEEPLNIKSTVETKIYNRDVMKSKELNFNSNVPKGTIASVTAESKTNEIYKGYMYANSEKTLYTEEYNMEISYVDGITATLELQEDNFKTEQNSTITTNNQTEYNTIKINKEKLAKILGDKGTLKIVPENKELSEIEIDKTTSADKEGNIVIDYEKIKNSHNVIFRITGAENEGTLKVLVEKAIKGNAGYDKETLKTINAIQTTVKSYTNAEKQESTATATTELKETVTEATLSMNNNNILSTTNTNDIEFIATLKTGTMDTDLLKAPTVKINLPEEVTKTELTSVSALYAEEELKIASSEVVDDNKAILVKLDGEQFNYNNKLIEGIKITINAKITLIDTATSRDTNIEMKYTNENSAEKEYTATVPVSIQAPYGIVTKAIIKVDFESENKGVEAFKTLIINNYEKSIENIAVIGTMPNVEKSKEEFEKAIKENIKTSATDIELEIVYSKDEEKFDDTFENAKTYKITLKDSKLEAGERLSLELIENVSKILTNFKLAYQYNGVEEIKDVTLEQISSNISEIQPEEQVETPTTQQEEQTQEPEEEKQPLELTMLARTANKEIKDKDELVEAQTIRYIFTITNNTNKDMENVKFTGNHEGANVLEYVAEEQPDSLNPGTNTNFTIEKEIEGKSKAEYKIGTLKAGEARKITYQIRIKEGTTLLDSKISVTADNTEEATIETTNAVSESELKLELSSNVAQEYPKAKGELVSTDFTIKNISDEKLENITVSFTIPKTLEYEDINEVEQTNNYTVIQKDKNILVFSIKELAAGASKTMTISLKSVAENETKKTELLKYSASVNNSTYYSNEAGVGTIAKNTSKFEVKQTASIAEGTVQTGDNLTYTITLKNVGDADDVAMLHDSVPEAAVIQKASYTIGNKTTQITEIENNEITEQIILKAGEEATVKIETQIDEEKTGKETITNKATVIGNYSENEVQTEEITHTLKANIKEKSEDENGEESQTPSIDGSQTPSEEPTGESTEETPNGSTEGTQTSETVNSTLQVKESISGIVWVDANKNGIRDNSEKKLSGIKVNLGNIETGKFVTDENGDKIEVTTNSNGEYKFENVVSGKYIVIFTYDNTKYRNTEYKVKGATEKTDSDVITSKLSTSNEDIKYAITDTLELKDESLENIDAGFIENEIFDLTLNKYVTKVTVQNTSGTVVKEYNKQQLAKLEIDAKNLAGSTVLVEYTMEVKNEGEIAGYANELIDYIPKDLKFNSEMNKEWYMSTDGNLHTTALAKTLINPGETATVTLILTKTMTENNTGLTSNNAEIAKSSNDLSIPDKDSKAGNNTQSEDDISTAEMIVSIRTGIEFTIGIIVAIIALTATGIIIYTKKRKEVSHE